MDIVNLLLTPNSWPSSGVWEAIIKWFFDGLGGKIALALVLLTICLKVVMLPLDFWQRRSSRKLATAQTEMKEELDAIKAKYSDPTVVNQKTMELYKKHHFSPTSGCLPMLVYLVVTWVVFFTLFSALGNISRTRINYEYYQLEQTYQTEYKSAYDSGDKGDFETLEAYATAVAQQKATEKYDSIREGFLSIKTIWRPDNWSTVFPSQTEFDRSTGTQLSVAKQQNEDGTTTIYVVKSSSGNKAELYQDLTGNVFAVVVNDSGEASTVAQVEIDGQTYTKLAQLEKANERDDWSDTALARAKTAYAQDFQNVTAGINKKYSGQWNGYLGLIILTAVITFMSQFLATLGTKTKDKKGNQMSANKPKPIMGIVMAGIMVAFTISYTSLFALYIVVSNALSLIFSILMNLVMNKIDEHKEKKNTITPDYVRK